MATRRYMINPGEQSTNVTQAVGAATAAKAVELTIDLSSAIIADPGVSGGTRQIQRGEVLKALDDLKTSILSGIWPPA